MLVLSSDCEDIEVEQVSDLVHLSPPTSPSSPPSTPPLLPGPVRMDQNTKRETLRSQSYRYAV